MGVPYKTQNVIYKKIIINVFATNSGHIKFFAKALRTIPILNKFVLVKKIL
jgi:hypothetical protein